MASDMLTESVALTPNPSSSRFISSSIETLSETEGRISFNIEIISETETESVVLDRIGMFLPRPSPIESESEADIERPSAVTSSNAPILTGLLPVGRA